MDNFNDYNNNDGAPKGRNDDGQQRVRLQVMGLSYSQIQTGAYALILAQVDGPYRIPIVIGAAEAQSIALQIEKIKPTRPLTHDLFRSFAHAFGIRLLEVFVYKFEDGIFSSEMKLTDGNQTIVIDSRTSDAIAIAMRTNAPIYTTPEILNQTGFILEEQNEGDEGGDDESGSPAEEPAPQQPRIENYAIEELERELERLISLEDYEQAARVSEILKRKRGE